MPYAPPHQSRPRGLLLGRLCVVLSLLCLFVRTARAQADASPSRSGGSLFLPLENEAGQGRGLAIGSIRVAGNRRITSEDILAYLTEKIGQTFAPEALSKDVRELWNSGFFDDIEVDLERDAGKVSLRFVVRERPNISAIEFEGNSEIDTEDLTEAIEVKAN